ESPRQQLIIRFLALEGFSFESCIINFEEGATARIKIGFHCRAPRWLPAGRQFSRRGEPHLVQHATEINNAAHLIERAAKSGNDGWIRRSCLSPFHFFVTGDDIRETSSGFHAGPISSERGH